MSDTVKVEIANRLDDLEWDCQQARELRVEIEKDTPKETQELLHIQESIKGLREMEERVLLKRQEKVQNLYLALVGLERDIQKKTEDLKTYCHRLPQDVLENGISAGSSGWRVTVSKGSFQTSYDTERLVREMPELEEMYIDNDPVLKRTIAPEVLERLIANGDIQEDEVEPYRITVKLRNPSVSILPPKEST